MPSTLNISQLILQKRNGKALSEQQIIELVQGYTLGQIPDYQLSALAMAIYFQGLNHDETVALTRAKAESGQTLNWTCDDRPVIDKHSTGGVGDKTSLILVPLLACFDVRIPKLSGRGLGTTGGTLDKLESIPGFRVNYTTEDFQKLVRRVGCAIVSANQDLAPADKKLYALRDVTGTVDVIPLITASILSKKMAEGLDALVLDVKCGHGALMHDLEKARHLARTLVDVAQDFRPRCVAVISDMNMPLGTMVGNACEVMEAVEVLRENHAGPLRDLVLGLGSELLVSASLYESEALAREALQQKLASGHAFDKFGEMVRAQEGQWPCEFRLAPKYPIRVISKGWVRSIDGRTLGRLCVDLGGGRKTKDDSIDHGVGIEILVGQGERVEPGQVWAHVYSRRDLTPQELTDFQHSLALVEQPPKITSIVLDRVTA